MRREQLRIQIFWDVVLCLCVSVPELGENVVFSFSGVKGDHKKATPVYLLTFLLPHYLSFFLWRCGPTRAMAFSVLRFLDHTQRRVTVDRAPLDKWSDGRRDFYLTTHNTHNKLTSMLSARFEPTLSAGKRPHTYTLDGAATGTGNLLY